HTRSYGDWSSDVCSSDLVQDPRGVDRRRATRGQPGAREGCVRHVESGRAGGPADGPRGCGRGGVRGHARGRGDVPALREEREGRSEERRVGKGGRGGGEW